MKKILFLLLLITSSIYAQSPTGQEQEFDYGIRNNAAQIVTSTDTLVTHGTSGTYGKITFKNLTNRKAYLSTGLLKNGALLANVDLTKFDITAGIGIISNFDDPENPVSTIINFPAFTGVTPTYLLTGNITYVAINSVPAVVMQSTPFTDIQRRDLIELGAVIHSNLTTINVINNISSPSNAGTNQLHDLMDFIGALNLTGNKYSPNGANLQLNKSAGVIGKRGVNFVNNWKDPHRLAQSAGTALTFRYRTQNGTEGTDRINLDPALYDLNNVLTAVPNNKFTIQTVVMFQSGLTRILYGQNTYDDLPTAKAAVFTRAFNVESNSQENGIIRAYVIMRNTTTSLQNPVDADILEAQKFGGVASGGVALTFANIVSALGYTPEDVANKTGTLTASSILYPNNDAVNKRTPFVTLEEFGAVGDGVTDDSTAIQSALTSTTINGGTILVSNKTFLCGNLIIYSNTDLVGMSEKSKFKFKSGAQYLLSINPIAGGTVNIADNQKNINIKNIHFEGRNQEDLFDQFKHLLNINAASFVTVDNCSFTAFQGDGIYVGSSNTAATERHNTNITITNSFFDGINKENRNGISVIDCDKILIDNCKFFNTTKSTMPAAIDVEPNAFAFAIIKNISISNNYFYNIGGNVGTIAVVIPISQENLTVKSSNINISNNSIESSAYGITAVQTTLDLLDTTPILDLSINNNSVSNITNTPISIRNIRGFNVTGNYIQNYATRIFLGFTSEKIKDGIIDNNIFKLGGTFDGIGVGVFTSDRLIFKSNTFEDCGKTDGTLGYSIDFSTNATSTYINLENNIFTSPNLKTTFAIQKEVTHTLTTSTNISTGNKLIGVTGNAFTAKILDPSIGTANKLVKWFDSTTNTFSASLWSDDGTTLSAASNIVLANAGSAETYLSVAGGRVWRFVAKAVGTSTFAIRDNSFGADRLTIGLTGIVGIPVLAGTGGRVVTADTNGNLSATKLSPKVYTALITQSGTAAPTAIVLENTLGGTVVWTRSSTGIYLGTLTGAFTLDKTFCLSEPSTHPSFISTTRLDANSITIATDNSAGVVVDGYLNNATVEIRVYN